MADSSADKRILLLSLCGFVYKLGATFAVLLSFSSFLKIAGRAALPEYYIWLSVFSLIAGLVMVGSRRWQKTSLRASYIVAPIFALLISAAGSQYAVLGKLQLMAVYVAVSLYDVYFGIIFWNTANSLLTVREMRQWVGVIAGVMFSGGIVLGYLMPALFSLFSYAACHYACAVIFLLLPLCVALLPRKEADEPEKNETHTVSWQKTLSLAAGHPLSLLIVGSMVVLAFSRYSSSYLFASALSRKFVDERDLASFSGAFESSLRLISLFSQSLLLPWLLKRFRPTALLFLTPAILMAGAAIMLVYPGFEGLVAFQFMLLLSIRTFDQNLVNLFLNLYEKALRNQFRFFSDGIIFASTVILTGLLLKTVAGLADDAVLYWLLLGAGSFYLLLARRAANDYQKALQANLAGRERDIGFAGGEGFEVLDYEAEMARISGQPVKTWPYLFGRMSRRNQEFAAGLIASMLKRVNSDEELSMLIRIAGRNGHHSLEADLNGFLSGRHAPRVIADAVESAYRLSGGRAIPWLQQLLSHSDNRVRANSVLALIRLAEDEESLRPALADLLVMAKSDEAGCRASAAAVLGELPHRCFSDLLRQLLFDKEARVRVAAMKSCEKWRSIELAGWLEECGRRFPEDRVRAEMALAALQADLMTLVEQLADACGLRHEVSSLTSVRRDRIFVELLLKLLQVLPGLPAIALLELLATHDQCDCPAKITACVAGAHGVALNSAALSTWLKADGCDPHAAEIMQSLLNCLDLAALSEVWQILQAEKPGVEARKMLFTAGCRITGIQEPAALWAGLTGADSAEKDLALELLETAKGAAPLLKSLTAGQC